MSGRGAAGAALLLVGLLGGCGSPGEAPRSSQSPPPSGGAGPEVAMTAVATDDLALASDGAEVVADCRSGICRWDVEDGELTVSPGSHLALDGGDVIAGATTDGTVVLADLDTGAEVATLTGLDGGASAVAFSPTGALVGAATDSGSVVVWEVSTGDEVSSFEVGAPVYAVAFDAEDQRLAVAGEAGAAVHDAATGDELAELSGSEPGAALAWSPDGRYLAASGSGGTATVWSTDTYEEIASVGSSGANHLAFSPDSQCLAITFEDDLDVTLWCPLSLGAPDVESSQSEIALSGMTTAPGSVVFAPNGRTVYAVGDPDGVRAWDTQSTEMIRTFAPPS